MMQDAPALASERSSWRSLLFVPGNDKRMLAGAGRRDADALVVDLEDSVPEAEKDLARENIAIAFDGVGSDRSGFLVRINNVPDRRDADIRAAIGAGAKTIVVPKVEDAAALIAILETIGAVERDSGLVPGSVNLVPLVETPKGLFRLREIAAAPAVVAIAFGDEDLALSLGCPSDSATLATFKHHLVVAAAEAGRQPLGLGCSIAQFGDLPAFQAGAMLARSWGMTGAFCIHPAQVAILNTVFAPREEDIVQARQIVEVYEAALASGRGAVAHVGTMIDRPIVERAYRTLKAATSASDGKARGGLHS
ncbi:CoA ester lyase [Mesorhizobium loti]|nr:CoA ester lyase [Mesorhizobium loti]PLP56654.1 CoA ester lyase [Mesorhizobium loti]